MAVPADTAAMPASWGAPPPSSGPGGQILVYETAPSKAPELYTELSEQQKNAVTKRTGRARRGSSDAKARRKRRGSVGNAFSMVPS